MSVYTFQLSFVKEKSWGGKKGQQFLMLHKKGMPSFKAAVARRAAVHFMLMSAVGPSSLRFQYKC